MRIPLFDFEQHRIIMESNYAFGGADYLHFPEGVEHYHLYRSTRKINTFAELQYIGEKFVYLNPDFDIELTKRLFVALSDRESGHIIRTYSAERVEGMIEFVHNQQKKPFCPRLRKIVFNPSVMISKSEKMQIVGELIGRKERPENEEIEETISELYVNFERITIKRVASELNTTPYLIRAFFDDSVMKSIKNANKEIRYEKQIHKAIEAIDKLTDNGNKLKMRQLKKLTSIRNYQALKDAVNRYQNDV